MEVRVQKYLSDEGICSRREAEELIRRGLVSINGAVVKEMGVKIDPEKDRVELLREARGREKRSLSVAFNKPRGVVSSRIQTEGKTIYDMEPKLIQLDIVGRLDKESEGLIILSNDGVIARAVTGDDHVTEKEYEVTVQEEISERRLVRSFLEGMDLKDGKTLPARVKVVNKNTFKVILKEGRNHQIRRMCEHIRLTVIKLKRIRVGPVVLHNLKPGEYRPLSEWEVAELRGMRKSLKKKESLS